MSVSLPGHENHDIQGSWCATCRCTVNSAEPEETSSSYDSSSDLGGADSSQPDYDEPYDSGHVWGPGNFGG